MVVGRVSGWVDPLKGGGVGTRRPPVYGHPLKYLILDCLLPLLVLPSDHLAKSPYQERYHMFCSLYGHLRFRIRNYTELICFCGESMLVANPTSSLQPFELHTIFFRFPGLFAPFREGLRAPALRRGRPGGGELQEGQVHAPRACG